MSVARRIAKNTFSLTVGELVSKALLFFLTVLIARNLGSAGLGNYSFAISFTVLFYMLADMGLNKLALRDLPRDKTKLGQYFYNILTIKFFLSIITFVAIVLSINLTNQPYEIKLIVYLAGIYMIISESIATLFRNVFVSFEQVEYEALVTIIEKILIFALGYISLIKSQSLFWLFVMFLIAGIIKAIIGFIIIIYKFKPKFSINFKAFLPLIKNAFPFSLTYLLATVYIKVDITMLTLMRNSTEVGWYTAAANLIFALVIIPAVFMRAVFPNMTRYYKTDKTAFIRSCRLSLKYLIIVGMPICIGGIITSKQLIKLIYGEGFSESTIAFQILLVFLFLYFIKWALNIALYAADLEKKVVWSYLVGLLVNVGLNFILIPIWSYIGAGITTIITEMIVVTVIYHYFITRISRLVIQDYLIKPLISVAIMGFVIYFLDEAPILLTILIGGIVYTISILFLKTLDNEDKRLIRQVLKV